MSSGCQGQLESMINEEEEPLSIERVCFETDRDEPELYRVPCLHQRWNCFRPAILSPDTSQTNLQPTVNSQQSTANVMVSWTNAKGMDRGGGMTLENAQGHCHSLIQLHHTATVLTSRPSPPMSSYALSTITSLPPPNRPLPKDGISPSMRKQMDK